VPRYFHLEAQEPLLFRVDRPHEAIAEIGRSEPVVSAGPAQAAAIGAAELRAVPICDVDLPHFSHISDDEEFRFQMGVLVLGHEKDRHSGGAAYRWGSRDLHQRKGVHLRLVNVGARRLLDTNQPSLGFPVCLVCGQSRSPFSSQTELSRFSQDHHERCGKPVESTGFYADVVADAFSLPSCRDRDEAYSILEAIRTGAAQILDMETEDLEILVIGRAGVDQVDALLYDPMPGGSGLLDQIRARFDEVVGAAREVVETCPSGCARGCIDCLYRFRNVFFHSHLDRKLAAEKLAEWGSELEFGHEIPPRMARDDRSGSGLPVNRAEQTLRAMLTNAGFPEGQWQRQIDLGRPLGTTTPDCYYRDDDPDEPGICIYLDGLSRHIHGNEATRRQDRQIREQLRADDYEVIEIAASDLYDRAKMARHFHKLGRLLLGRSEARRVRDNTEWFTSPDDIDGTGEGPGPKAEVLPFRAVDGAENERYRTCVPLLSLKAAAGGFGDTIQVEAEEWVEPHTSRTISEGMFVAQVVGKSMEPLISDGSYCLFKAPVVGSRTGRIVLVEHRDIDDPDNGGSYTVKKFDSTQVSGKDEGSERTGTIYLIPLNPDYEPIVLTDVAEDDVKVVAELVEVLRPNQPRGNGPFALTDLVDMASPRDEVAVKFAPENRVDGCSAEGLATFRVLKNTDPLPEKDAIVIVRHPRLRQGDKSVPIAAGKFSWNRQQNVEDEKEVVHVMLRSNGLPARVDIPADEWPNFRPLAVLKK